MEYTAGNATHGRRLLIVGACGGTGCPNVCTPTSFNTTSCPIVYDNYTLFTPSPPVDVEITYSQYNNVVGSQGSMYAVAYSACAAMKAFYPSNYCNNRYTTSIYAGCTSYSYSGAGALQDCAYELTFYDYLTNTQAAAYASQMTTILTGNNATFLNTYIRDPNIGGMSLANGVFRMAPGTIPFRSPPPPQPSPPPSPFSCTCINGWSGLICNIPPNMPPPLPNSG